MPLVVPALRLAYLFVNVFDTFKVLRLPPPSARNGGQPSARAMSQRKRAMKGTMTVWIVWTCFTLYERWVETIIYLFIPFYSEIKALFILFFILTRAKGAEPIFLHLLRPLIKPYTVPLDALFDGLASAGDLLILIASIPIQHARGYYRRWISSHDPPEADVNSWHADALRAGGRPTAHRAYVSEGNGDPRPASKRDISTGSVRQTRSSIASSGSSTPSHQIWYPPASAYADDDALNPHSGLPTPPLSERQLQQSADGSVDEWRQYPPFPSAYPATPLPASSRLPAERNIVAPKPVRPSGPQFSGIDEESDEENGTNPGSRQDFRRSLQLPREPQNPGSDGGLSDEHQMNGVQRTQQPDKQPTQGTLAGEDPSASEMSVDEDAGSDMDYEDEEDDFDVTLRTPYHRHGSGLEAMLSDDEMTTPPPTTIAFTISLDSQVSKTTTLSTTDNGSSLRTRTSSVSSTALFPVPEAEVVAGQKRRLPRYADESRKFNVRVSPRKVRGTIKAVASRVPSRSVTVRRQRSKPVADRAASQADEAGPADADDAAASDAPSLDPKRQKTVGGKITRPKPIRTDTDKTVRGPATRPAAKSATRPALSRPPSSRIAAARKERPPLKKKSSAASTASAAVARKQATAAPAGKTQKGK
ncbi:hypothetical protein BD413DRAFT_526838 [Trametes elegans]|nr:hypothetical protein BD413DRAFT_526838 [Trametes elegans]